MEKLTKEQIEHIAALARLQLSEEEKLRFQEQLSLILEYVGKLQEVDTSMVDPTAYILDVKNVTREDVVSGCTPEQRKILIEDLPDKKDDLARVPPVF